LRACVREAYSRVFTGVDRLATSLLMSGREDRLGNICHCGSEIVPPARALVCGRCGAACCPVCAYVLESAVCCARCAESLIEQGSEPTVCRLSSRRKPSAPPTAESAEWIILVARDQGDLFSHLERAFARDDKVQIIVDRRKDYRRNPPGVEERLRIHGAVVVKRPRR
jgi:hypothetical protein